MYLLYLVLPGLSEGGRSPGLLTSVALLPTNSPPALSVAWTLVHEMIFYLVFALRFMSRKALWVALALWGAAIGLAWGMEVEHGRALQYILSPLNLCFLLGVLIHALVNRVQVSRHRSLLLAVLGGSLVVFQAAQPEPVRAWVAVGFGLLVLAAATSASTRGGPARFLVIVGTASYSIYLVHNPLLSLAARVADRIGLDGSPAFVAISSAALAGGLVYWFVYERTMLRLVRRWIGGRRNGDGQVQMGTEAT